MATRTSERQTNHDQWVEAIARDRFRYPNEAHPTWSTFANPGSTKNARVVLANGAEVYPDIVVIDSEKPSTDNVPIYAEVETEDSVSESAVAQWKDYGSDPGATFYLYVPKGTGSKAKQLAKGIRVSGFREYSNQNGKNTYAEI